MEPGYLLAGFSVGLLIGLTGVGGGALMTPLLVLGFQVPTLTAVGTDLVYAAITKGCGLLGHSRQRSIRWDLAGSLALGSVPASIATLMLMHWLGPVAQLEQLVSKVLSLALLATSLVLLFGGRLLGRGMEHGHAEPPDGRRILALSGVLLGILVTLTSVGAGALTAAILLLLYPGIRGTTLVGTDLAHALPLAAVAGLGHLGLGTVDFPLLSGLLIGALPGVLLGVRLGRFLPDRLLRTVLALLLMLLGLKLAF